MPVRGSCFRVGTRVSTRVCPRVIIVPNIGSARGVDAILTYVAALLSCFRLAPSYPWKAWNATFWILCFDLIISSGSTYPAFLVVDSEGCATWFILAIILTHFVFWFYLYCMFFSIQSCVLRLILYFTFILSHFILYYTFIQFHLVFILYCMCVYIQLYISCDPRSKTNKKNFKKNLVWQKFSINQCILQLVELVCNFYLHQMIVDTIKLVTWCIPTQICTFLSSDFRTCEHVRAVILCERGRGLSKACNNELEWSTFVSLNLINFWLSITVGFHCLDWQIEVKLKHVSFLQSEGQLCFSDV